MTRKQLDWMDWLVVVIFIVGLVLGFIGMQNRHLQRRCMGETEVAKQKVLAIHPNALEGQVTGWIYLKRSDIDYFATSWCIAEEKLRNGHDSNSNRYVDDED